ncbi:MAG: hypothetical protein IPM42_17550 [Saprospiraceae bacterium]|nr:hypothetical protein [Saprospiraceae bacterium]
MKPLLIILLFVTLNCTDNQRKRNSSPELIYPFLAHLENMTPYSNSDINKRFEECKKVTKMDSLYKNSNIPDSMLQQYCICFIDKTLTQLRKSQLSETSKVFNLSQDCFVELGILDYMKGENHSVPDREKYKNKIQKELEHLIGKNGWAEPVIISIHENCITNQFMKNEFIKYDLLSEFNNYCNCLTKTIVNSEHPEFLASKTSDSKIEKYSNSCIKPYIQVNSFGWGPEDITDMENVFKNEQNWVNIARENKISIDRLSECIANTIANSIQINDISDTKFRENVEKISEKCLMSLKNK